MEFFNSAVDVLQTLVIALGAGLGIWGVVNLLEGYGQASAIWATRFSKYVTASASSCSDAVNPFSFIPFDNILSYL